MKCWAGWSTSWNQNYWEKYQQPQIWRWHHPYGRKQRGTKEPLDEGERRVWKSWLKTQHLKDKDHGIHPITSGQIDVEKVETVRFHFHGLQNHCRCWLQPWNKRRLLLGRIAMINLDSILKSRDITLPTKVCLVKAMAFPIVMCGCESWTRKRSEHWRVDAFELWY